MLSYDALCRHPDAFPNLTGLTRAECDALAPQFEAAERDVRAATPATRRERQPRRNAPGAGHPDRNDARTRRLMAPAWLRTYPTCDVLGFFSGLHKRNAQLNVRAALEALDALDSFQRADLQPGHRLGQPARRWDRTHHQQPGVVEHVYPHHKLGSRPVQRLGSRQ